MSFRLSKALINAFTTFGIKEAFIAPGSRNSPVIKSIYESDLKFTQHFDERALGFKAMGAAKRLNSPTLVVTTSGTAVAELLPSCIESYYQSIPLIFLTADRPKRFRHTGAPQAINQEGLFGVYACYLEIEDAGGEFDLSAISEWDMKQPLHINFCIEEPFREEFTAPLELRLLKTSAATKNPNTLLDQFLKDFQNPLLLVGPLRKEDRNNVAEFISAIEAPFYAETLSGLRGLDPIKRYSLINERNLLELPYDSFIRIGGVPTTSMFRDLERDPRLAEIPLFNIAYKGLAGISRSNLSISLEEVTLPTCKSNWGVESFNKIEVLNAAFQKELDGALDTNRDSEQSFIREIARVYGSESYLYLGNSLPIRNWDRFTPWHTQHNDVWGNRGANGIDGQISSFLGWKREGGKNICILGDLTSLYDMNAFYGEGATQDPDFSLFIINNQGGRIFEELPYYPKEFADAGERFLNPQNVDFSHLAKLWSLPYSKVESLSEFSLSMRGIIEICPNNSESLKVKNLLKQY